MRPCVKHQGRNLCSSKLQIPQRTSLPNHPLCMAALLPPSLPTYQSYLLTTTSDMQDPQLAYLGSQGPQFLRVCNFLHSLPMLDLGHCRASQTFTELDSPPWTSDPIEWSQSWSWQPLDLPLPRCPPLRALGSARPAPLLQLTLPTLLCIFPLRLRVLFLCGL